MFDGGFDPVDRRRLAAIDRFGRRPQSRARRGDIRYRVAGQRGTHVAHTLNGSALAVPRVWAAILENFRQADGSVALPHVLLPYMRGATIIPAT